MRSVLIRAAVATTIVVLAGLSTGIAVLAPVGPQTDETGAQPDPSATWPTTGPAPPATGPGPLTTPLPADQLRPGTLPEPPADPDALRAADPHLEDLAERFLADPAVAGHPAGLSVWVEGSGEVLAAGAAQELQPASVQKLVTAIAVLERVEPEFRFVTVVTGTAPVGPDGTIRGDLVLVGGGDPTLGRAGLHSLEELAAQVAAAGVRRVEGRVLVDVSRWSTERAAPGWLAWHQPRFVGWLSALIADENRWQTGADQQDPAGANGRWFAEALGRQGVTVAGGAVVSGAAASGPGATVLASVLSPPRDDLVRHMLLESDNLVAEALLHEVDRRAGGVGTYASADRATTAVLTDLLGRSPGGRVADGSGLSRDDRRSADEWTALLVAARGQPWWPVIHGGLPVAATSGTLSSRFGGTAAAGNLRAKTGTTIESRALAGVFTTASGRTAVFAVTVNGTAGDGPIGAEYAIDQLIADLVAAT